MAQRIVNVNFAASNAYQNLYTLLSSQTGVISNVDYVVNFPKIASGIYIVTSGTLLLADINYANSTGLSIAANNAATPFIVQLCRPLIDLANLFVSNNNATINLTVIVFWGT
jgi:hypothetical protein